MKESLLTYLAGLMSLAFGISFKTGDPTMLLIVFGGGIMLLAIFDGLLTYLNGSKS